MAQVRLTLSRIAGFSCTKGSQSFLWDSDVSGLGVRATPSGRKTFIFQSRLNGKALRITLKDVKAITIEDAHRVAKKYAAQIAEGIDPRDYKRQIDEESGKARKKREERQASDSLRDVKTSTVWAEYLSERKPEWGDRHYKEHLKLAQAGGQPIKRRQGVTKEGPLFPILQEKTSELSTDTIEKWLKKEVKSRPSSAALALRMLRAFINWCSIHQTYGTIITSDIITRKTKKIPPKAKAKNDSLPKEQLYAWFRAVQEIHNPVISAYLQSLLLTGARREELAGLKWENVDFRWNKLTISDKVEDTRTIPLTPYVKHLLSWLPRRNEWVFYSPRAKSGRLQEPRTAHNKAIAETGIEKLTLHGLRRSFSSLSEWIEVPSGIVAQIMGHKPSATVEKHYKVRPIDLLRLWHTKIEEWILEQAKISLPEQKEEEQPLKAVAVNK